MSHHPDTEYFIRAHLFMLYKSTYIYIYILNNIN